MTDEAPAAAADAGRQTSGPGADAQARRIFEANRKSAGLAYVFWFFLGWFGVHRFYLGRSGSGGAMLLVIILTAALLSVGMGFLGILALAIWLLVDAFLIPGMARSYNLALVQRIERELGSGKPEASGIPPYPGPDADGVTRIIPKAIWDGPQGDFLREIGAAPDDASNLMPTPESVQARHDEAFRQQTAFVEEVNRNMPDGARVIPWAMLPCSLWSGPHADFLLATCERYPAEIWNMMLLPEDDRSAEILKLPKHLGGFPPNIEEAITRLVGELRERLSEVHARTGAAMAKGDMSALDDYSDAVGDARAKLRGLAHFMSSEIYGKEAYERHKELFGEALGWGTGL